LDCNYSAWRKGVNGDIFELYLESFVDFQGEAQPEKSHLFERGTSEFAILAERTVENKKLFVSSEKMSPCMLNSYK